MRRSGLFPTSRPEHRPRHFYERLCINNPMVRSYHVLDPNVPCGGHVDFPRRPLPLKLVVLLCFSPRFPRSFSDSLLLLRCSTYKNAVVNNVSILQLQQYNNVTTLNQYPISPIRHKCSRNAHRKRPRAEPSPCSPLSSEARAPERARAGTSCMCQVLPRARRANRAAVCVAPRNPQKVVNNHQRFLLQMYLCNLFQMYIHGTCAARQHFCRRAILRHKSPRHHRACPI